MKTLDDLKRELKTPYNLLLLERFDPENAIDWLIDHLHSQGRIVPDGYVMQLDDVLDMVCYLLPLAKGYVDANPGIRSTECIIEDAEAMIAAAKKVGE